jgi:hypothetical protein
VKEMGWMALGKAMVTPWELGRGLVMVMVREV